MPGGAKALNNSPAYDESVKSAVHVYEKANQVIIKTICNFEFNKIF